MRLESLRINDADDPRTREVLGEVYQSLDKLHSAVSNLEMAQRFREQANEIGTLSAEAPTPSMVQLRYRSNALHHLAQNLQRLGKPKAALRPAVEARDLLVKAVEMTAEDVAMLVHLAKSETLVGLLLSEAKRFEESEQQWLRATKIADRLATQGESQEAAAARAAIERGRAAIYEATGRDDEAKQARQRAANFQRIADSKDRPEQED